jgi:hypothetical protein
MTETIWGEITRVAHVQGLDEGERPNEDGTSTPRVDVEYGAWWTVVPEGDAGTVLRDAYFMSRWRSVLDQFRLRRLFTGGLRHMLAERKAAADFLEQLTYERKMIYRHRLVQQRSERERKAFTSRAARAAGPSARARPSDRAGSST